MTDPCQDPKDGEQEPQRGPITTPPPPPPPPPPVEPDM